jgi:pyridoxine 5-phosphate synthase
MIHLGVNIDHVATIRQARRGAQPEVIHAAALAVLGGADSITIHLREDRRHIQDRDLRLLREVATVPLNLEMAATEEMTAIAIASLPACVTLVPEKREELTTEGGLDVITHQNAIGQCLKALKSRGVPVSLFIDPDARQVEMARFLGADAIELQTGSYSEATNAADREARLADLKTAARLARQCGLRVHAGHGLDYHNVQAVAAIADIVELNIGHSIISRAILVGMVEAVRAMKHAMVEGRRG